ncbi:MAG: hypothetical protein JRN35_06135 [Nitrososphaerota archaeon]|nr:hypothetical protein [Nitrososphaerota archaeon]
MRDWLYRRLRPFSDRQAVVVLVSLLAWSAALAYAYRCFGILQQASDLHGYLRVLEYYQHIPPDYFYAVSTAPYTIVVNALFWGFFLIVVSDSVTGFCRRYEAERETNPAPSSSPR